MRKERARALAQMMTERMSLRNCSHGILLDQCITTTVSRNLVPSPETVAMFRYAYRGFDRQRAALPPLAPQYDLIGRRSSEAGPPVPDNEEAASHGHGGGYSITAYDDECCPEVFDITSLLATLGIIGGGALALGGLFQNLFANGGRKSLGPLETGLEWLALEYVNGVELFFHSGGKENASYMQFSRIIRMGV